MEEIISITTKAELISALIKIKKGLECITKFHINLNDIGFIEDKDLLYKVLYTSNTLCKIYYQHTISNLDNWYALNNKSNSNLDNWYTLSNKSNPLYTNSTHNKTDTFTMNGEIYQASWIRIQQYQYDPFTLQYNISPIKDLVRFNNLLKNRVSFINNESDFHLKDSNEPLSTRDIYVLKPKHLNAINILYNIFKDKLNKNIKDYIFLFKCGDDWYTLSRIKYINISYYDNNTLNINETFYKIERR